MLVRALLQKRDLASRAHEVICALLDASKVGLCQVNSTAAALAGLDAIMYYSALICPDTTTSKLELVSLRDGVTDMILVIATMSSATIWITFSPSSGVNADWHYTSCWHHDHRNPDKFSFCMHKHHLTATVLQGECPVELSGLAMRQRTTSLSSASSRASLTWLSRSQCATQSAMLQSSQLNGKLTWTWSSK